MLHSIDTLLQAKRHQRNQSLCQLVLKDDLLDCPSPSTAVLLSQYASALTDDSISLPSESATKLKLLHSVLFALMERQIKRGKWQNVLRLLMSHSDRKKDEKSHILLYNISKLHQRQGEPNKQVFYLQTLLKEQPFFPPAIHDLALCLATSARLPQALSLLQRHLSSLLGEHYLIQTAFFICLQRSSTFSIQLLKVLHSKTVTLTNAFNLALLLRKKGEFERAVSLFSEIIHKLDSQRLISPDSLKSGDWKLYLLSHINLIKISLEQHSPKEGEALASHLIQAHSSLLDQGTLASLRFLCSPKDTSQSSNQSVKEPKISDEFGCPEQGKSEDCFESLFYRSRQDNTSKLRSLLDKEKSIDSFFKNLKLKYSSSGQLLSVLTNSINSAKKELFSGPQALFQNLHRAEESSKVKVHLSQFGGSQMQDLVQNLLVNLEILKQGVPPKAQPSPGTRQSVKPMPIQSLVSPSRLACKENSFRRESRKDMKTTYLCSLRSDKSCKVTRNICNLTSDRSFNKFRIKPLTKISVAPEPATSPAPVVTQESSCAQGLKEDETNRTLKAKQTCKQADPAVVQQALVLEKKDQCSQKVLKPGLSEIVSERVRDEAELIEKCTDEGLSSSERKFLQSQKTITAFLQGELRPVSDKRDQPEEQSQPDQAGLDFQQGSRKIPEGEEEPQKIQMNDKEVGNPAKEQLYEKYMPSNKQVELSGKDLEDKGSHINSEKKVEREAENNCSIHSEEQSQESHRSGTAKDNQAIFNIQIQQTRVVDQQNTPKDYPKQNQMFDPLASTFNLTGFSKTQLHQLGPQTLHPSLQTEQPSPSPFMFFEALAAPAKPRGELSEEFLLRMQRVEQLQKEGALEQAYQSLLEMYKQFKENDAKLHILIKIGEVFEQQERLDEAQKTFSKCTRFNSAEAFLRLGSLQLKIGKVDEGVQNLEKANCLKRFDTKIENRLVYGYSLKEETMDKALTLAHNILRKDPNSLQTLFITAGILQRQGLVEEAIQIVTAMDEAKQAQYIKHYLGVLYLEASNLKQAFFCFKAALNLQPDYLPSLIEVASIISEPHPKQAIAILNKVLELSPANRKALARLGKIYEAQGDFENAMNTYKVALESQENYQSYMKIGDCLAKKESYIEALLNYKEALNLSKTHQVHAKVALMFELKNEWSKAIEHYQAALALIPDTPLEAITRRSHLLAIGRLQLRLGQYETAISFLGLILECEESVEVLKLMGEASFGSKDYPAALGYFQRANQLDRGGNIQIMESMAMCLDRMEEYLASKILYEKILQKSPHNVRCLNNLGNILLITGETNQAFYLFEAMLQRAPRNLEKRLKLADIYAQVGDWSKVEYHLLQCYRQRQHDVRILQKLVLLYKEKRDTKMAVKYEKKISLIRASHKNKVS